MTRQKLEQQYIFVNGMTFTPRYTVVQIKNTVDGEIILIDDYTITATAQEVYQEYLAQKNAPPTPSIEERLTQLEVLQVNSMSIQIENKLLGGTV